MVNHFAFYKYVLALFLSFLLSASSAVTIYNKPALIIESGKDAVIDLASNTVIYDDTFGLYTTHSSIPSAYYKPLKGFVNSKYHKTAPFLPHWLKFSIVNKSRDSVEGFFYCGKQHLITLYDEHTVAAERGGLGDYTDTNSRLMATYYLPVALAPNEGKTFSVSIVNIGVVPAAIESKLFVAQQNPIINKLQSPLYFCLLLISCMLCGGILVLGMFNFVQYFTTRKPEYFFYGSYALAMFLNIERGCEWGFNLRIISQFIPSYFFTWATVLNVLSGIFYLLFTRYYLDLAKKSAANRVIQIALWILVSGFLLLSSILLFEVIDNRVLIIFRTFSLLPTLCSLILFVTVFVSHRNSSPLLFYYYIGFLFLLIGVGINVYINNFARHLMSEKLPAILLVEIGMLLEMILFALGLGYKARLHEKQKTEVEVENLKLLHQNEINLLEIRSRLSRDLHDDIGSTLSSINILSRTAQSNLNQTNLDKTKAALEKINDRSQRLLDNMSDIVWNINPDNDTIEEVINRIREYATTVLEAKKIDCVFDFSEQSVNRKLSVEVKSNMHLIFKEAVNNIAKYSGCTKAVFTLFFSENDIHLCINDNGVGFDEKEVKHRGGLVNMRSRAAEMNAHISIHAAIGKGTTIELIIPGHF
jgi:signal transduction histidine kinase